MSTDAAPPSMTRISRSLTVLVPALNERQNLEPTITTLLRALTITVEDFEIIIVDDGSTDGTGEIADRLGAQHPEIRVVHNPRNMGLGYSYLRSVELASKNFFVFVPADNTWPYRSFLELFGNMGKSDIVTSYTTNPEIRPLGRRIVSSLFTQTLNVLFGRRLHYYNGLTIYPIAFLRSKPITTYGFAFAAEALLKAIHQGLSFIEVALPINQRLAGRSKAVTVKNVLSVVVTLGRLVWALRLAPQAAPRQRPAEPSVTRPEDSGRGTARAARLSVSDPTWAGAAGFVRSGPREPLRILITGASGGIGAGLLEALSTDGHVMFGCARRAGFLEQAIFKSGIARGWTCDVTDEHEVREFVARVQECTPHIDALINCAGTLGAIGPFQSVDTQEWLDTVRVNLFGTYMMIKHVLPLLAKAGDPRITNFAGGGAFGARPNYSAYACSKAAVVRLTECLAGELAPLGVAVNAVAPGFVATDIHRRTLMAGAERAGALTYRRTKAIIERGGAEIGTVVECVRTLLSPHMRGLTGKTISVNFDPWRTKAFQDHLQAITHSDLYTMRRINVVNLPEGSLKTRLAEAWARDTAAL